jgi:hypothetical protein
MRRVFADAVYWVALASPHDQWHGRAVQATRALGMAQIITTEEVFVEFLAHFSGYGHHLWPKEAHRRRCDSLPAPVAVAAEAQPEALLPG